MTSHRCGPPPAPPHVMCAGQPAAGQGARALLATPPPAPARRPVTHGRQSATRCLSACAYFRVGHPSLPGALHHVPRDSHKPIVVPTAKDSPRGASVWLRLRQSAASSGSEGNIPAELAPQSADHRPSRDSSRPWPEDRPRPRPGLTGVLRQAVPASTPYLARSLAGRGVSGGGSAAFSCALC